MVGECSSPDIAGDGGIGHGGHGSGNEAAQEGIDTPFGPRMSVCKRSISGAIGIARDRMQYESGRRPVGQCVHGTVHELVQE